MKITEKSKRLAGVVEKILPQILYEETTPDKDGFITVMAVEISGDLQICDVFVRVLQGPPNALKRLRRRRRTFEHLLNQHLRLDPPLTLRFKEDKSVAHVEKLKKLGL